MDSTIGANTSFWYFDPLSCLYSTIGTLLHSYGRDPLRVLGRNCQFELCPLDVPLAEYYHIERPGSLGLVDTIAPDLSVDSIWESLGSISELADHVQREGFVVLAVDNFYLPFRPAFNDVHAAHLVIVSDSRVDPVDGLQFYLIDAQPPAFRGWISADAVAASTFSHNPPDVQDKFFSAKPIEGRFLRFELPTASSVRELSLRDSLSRMATNWTNPTVSDNYLSGLPAVDYLATELARSTDDASDTSVSLSMLYTFGWSPQAEAFLAASNFTQAAQRENDLCLLKIAGLMRDVSLAWTELRLAGAYSDQKAAVVATDTLRNRYSRFAAAASDWLLRPDGTHD